MTLGEQLKHVRTLFIEKNLSYALAGGLITSVYRSQERMTKDIDVLLLTEDKQAASQLLKDLNLEPHPIHQAQLEGGPKHAIKRKSTPVWMILGLVPKDKDSIRVDLILPGMPWFHLALQRAESNQIDFGFGKIPCLTKEDIILSKLYALRNRSDRFQDLDDLKNIFSQTQPLDLAYLISQMKALNLSIPPSLKHLAPKNLLKIK